MSHINMTCIYTHTHTCRSLLLDEWRSQVRVEAARNSQISAPPSIHIRSFIASWLLRISSHIAYCVLHIAHYIFHIPYITAEKSCCILHKHTRTHTHTHIKVPAADGWAATLGFLLWRSRNNSAGAWWFHIPHYIFHIPYSMFHFQVHILHNIHTPDLEPEPGRLTKSPSEPIVVGVVLADVYIIYNISYECVCKSLGTF